MEKRVITIETVDATLRSYERRFGLSTDEFYEAHYIDGDRRVAHMPRRHRSRWASMARTRDRMAGGGSVAERITREFEPV
jgi:hypothetical protein